AIRTGLVNAQKSHVTTNGRKTSRTLWQARTCLAFLPRLDYASCVSNELWNGLFDRCPEHGSIESKIIMRDHISGRVRLLGLKFGKLILYRRIQFERFVCRFANI